MRRRKVFLLALLSFFFQAESSSVRRKRRHTSENEEGTSSFTARRAATEPYVLDLTPSLPDRMQQLDPYVSGDFLDRLKAEEELRRAALQKQQHGVPTKRQSLSKSLLASSLLFLLSCAAFTNTLNWKVLLQDLKTAASHALHVWWLPLLLHTLVSTPHWSHLFVLYPVLRPDSIMHLSKLIPESYPVLRKVLVNEFWSFFWKTTTTKPLLELVHRGIGKGTWLDTLFEAVLKGTQKMFISVLQRELQESMGAWMQMVVDAVQPVWFGSDGDDTVVVTTEQSLS